MNTLHVLLIFIAIKMLSKHSFQGSTLYDDTNVTWNIIYISRAHIVNQSEHQELAWYLVFEKKHTDIKSQKNTQPFGSWVWIGIS